MTRIQDGDRRSYFGRPVYVVTVDPPQIGTALVQELSGPNRGQRWYVPVTSLDAVTS